MSTTRTKVPEGQALLDAIVAKREELLALRKQVDEATHDLAVLVAATKDDPDPSVNPTAAARAMGLHKQRAFQMIESLHQDS